MNRNFRLVSNAKPMLGFWLAVCCLYAVGQKPDYGRPNPTLDFRCTRYSIPMTSSMEMRGEVVGMKELLGDEWTRKLKYDWTASAGQIVEGQGTPKIIWAVGSEQNLRSVVLTLDVKGVPEISSPQTCSIKFDSTCSERRVADYHTSDLKKEEAILDVVAQRLRLDQTSIAYIVMYAVDIHVFGSQIGEPREQ